MRKTAIILSCAMTILSAPAHAVEFTRVEITNALGEWLQVAEVQAFSGGVNVAAAAKGGTATGTGDWTGTLPQYAIDGNIDTAFPNIWHSSTNGFGAKLTIDLDGVYDVSNLAIFGRSDFGSDRDLFNFTLFNGADIVGKGLLDARNETHFASQGFEPTFAAAADETAAVPEPATWAMMLVGFGAIGFAMRRKQPKLSRVAFAA